METDRALLAWAAANPSHVAFRTYGWSRPTLSLGRAEPFPRGWDVVAIDAARVEVVRRPTGGDAVLHHGELTFAIAAGIPGSWGLRPRAFADLVAESLADSLRGLDLPAARIQHCKKIVGASTPGAHPCFARSASGEVRVGSYKVAGIASRFMRGAALCHASVPLSARHRDVAEYRSDRARDRFDLDRHARSATELLGRTLDAPHLGDRLAAALASRLGTTFRPASFAELGLEEPRDA